MTSKRRVKPSRAAAAAQTPADRRPLSLGLILVVAVTAVLPLVARHINTMATGTDFNGIQNQPCTLEILDDYAFRCTFDYTFGLFPHILTRHMGGYPQEGPLMPAHIMKDYHPDYAGEEVINQLMEEWGMETWEQVTNRFPGQWGLNIWQ